MQTPTWARSNKGRKPGKKAKTARPYAILLRPFPKVAAPVLSNAAQIRGLSQGVYVAHLVGLHQALLVLTRKDVDWTFGPADLLDLLQKNELGPVEG